ncbi:MAG: serine racemase VanT catalytic subunit, partial [Clostridia bacterium]|nr:serine racemase VanT catalytic subunit [Clostridia bacterium]
SVHPGDVAVLIGKNYNAEITVYDLAEQANTISTEIVSRLGARLPRLCI